MEKFYIDRQFGQAIWIDVENGIVQNCYGETDKFNAKLNENYKGKSITFLNEDFIGRAMAGTYHHLRPDCITSIKIQIETIKSRIRNLWHIHSDNGTSKDTQLEIKGQINGLEIRQYKLERDLISEKQRIFTEHNFIL